MNIERLNKLIGSYINNFDMINNEVHDENMKWKAIYHFKKNFDINATDFYEMFKSYKQIICYCLFEVKGL